MVEYRCLFRSHKGDPALTLKCQNDSRCGMTIEPDSDDISLLKRIAQHDQAAIAELYDRYAQLLFAIALKSLGSTQESEEVVLDVFAQVWQTAAQYTDADGQVDAWLCRLARRRSLERLPELAKAIIVSDDTVDSQANQSSSDPIEDALVLERHNQVLTALAQLPKEQRQALELAYYQGLSQSGIAAQLGLPLGTVKTRIRLGLNKLRIALGNWGAS